MPAYTIKITAAGLAAAIASDALGLSLHLTHVALGAAAYNPTGAETALADRRETVTVAPGSRSGPTQITVNALFPSALYSGAAYTIGEVGYFAGDPASGGTLVIVVSAAGLSLGSRSAGGVDFDASCQFDLTGVPSGSVTVTIDTTASVSHLLLSDHEAGANPHPQYVRKAGDTMSGPLAISVAAGAVSGIFGANIVSDYFTVDTDKRLHHYGLAWKDFSDSGTNGSSAALSGYGGLRFYTAGTERLRVEIGGNIGVGTDTPARKLDVNGTGRFAGALTLSGNAASALEAVPKQQLDAAVPSASPLTGDSGSWTGPGGLTVQWGYVKPNDRPMPGDIGVNQHTYEVTFISPFTNMPLKPDLTLEENATSYNLPNIVLAYRNLSTIGFTLVVDEQTSATQDAKFHWKVCGYIAPP